MTPRAGGGVAAAVAGVGAAARALPPRADPGCPMSEDLEALRRWETSGATWQVLAREAGLVDVALLTCDAGEQVGRIRSAEADLAAYVGDRTRSDD